MLLRQRSGDAETRRSGPVTTATQGRLVGGLAVDLYATADWEIDSDDVTSYLAITPDAGPLSALRDGSFLVRSESRINELKFITPDQLHFPDGSAMIPESSTPDSDPTATPRPLGDFQTTDWSVLSSLHTPDFAEALAKLCQQYWYPIYDC